MAEQQALSDAVGIRVEDEHGTEAVARRLAAFVRRGDVIGLKGPLGSGKTVFARAFIRALTRREEDVPSPTFTLVQRYDEAGVAAGTVFHVDLYRLETADEVWELGIEEAVTEGVVLIEWPERLGPLRPRDYLEIVLLPDCGGREAAREIRVTPYGEWRERLAAMDLCGGVRDDGRT